MKFDDVRRLHLLLSFAGLVLAAAAGAVGAEVSSGSLPAIACVEKVREARIAREAGDSARARAVLEGAVGLPDCDLPALSGLLELVREMADASEIVALRGRLAAKLEDSSIVLPRGFLTQIARVGLTRPDPEMDRQLLATLERRRASAVYAGRDLPVEETAEILTLSADLAQRLDLAEAERASLDELLKIAPTDALRWRALLLDLRDDRWQPALALIDSLLVESAAAEALRYFRVQALAGLGRYDEMMREVETLAPPVPPTPGPQGAERPMELPSAVDFRLTGFVSLLVDMAWTMRDLGRDAEAAALFRRVLAYSLDNVQAQAALLHLYGTAEERAAAATATAARRDEETDPLVLFEEGTDLLGAGDVGGARELLARAAPGLSGTGYAEAAWNNLGTAAFKLERWEEAAAAFAEACGVNPDRVESHYKRALALFHLQRWSEAVAALKRTLELDPERNDAHFYLAGCYDRLGDPVAAARERALFKGSKQ